MRFEVLADQLIFAFRLVHRDLAARDHTQPVRGLELQIPQRRSKHEPAELRGRVFEREVQMAGIPDPAVRQLAFHPDFEEFVFEEVANPDRQRGDAEDHPSLRDRRRQSTIVTRSVIARRRWRADGQRFTVGG